MSGPFLESLIARLLRRGWLAADEVRDPGGRVVDHSARYGCYEFSTPSGRGAIVKAAWDGAPPGWPAREYRALVALSGGLGGSALGTALPRLRGGDARTGTLVMERIPHRGSLADWGLSGHLPPIDSLSRLGRAVRELHEIRKPTFASHRDRPHTPWVLDLGRPLPPSMLRETTPASLEVLRAVRASTALQSTLDELREGWRRESLIHQDLRWENCLVDPRGRRFRVRVIDWEQASLGDPAWDVGAFFGESLRAWLFGARERELVLSASACFWNGYASFGRRSAKSDEETLLRAVRFAGAWLLARVFERAETLESLDAPSVQSLRTASSLLTRPERACEVLFGLSTGRRSS